MSTYTCSDLHGMLYFYNEIKKYLKPDDVVIYLGDAGDRGPHPWLTIKTILADTQFVYLKGNHEDMLCKALEECLIDKKLSTKTHHLLGMNDALPTLEQALGEEDIPGYKKKLEELPLIYEYTNKQGQKVYLSHAGFTPWSYEDEPDKLALPFDTDLLWDRDHFLDEWTADECIDCYIVHGHTPIPYLLDDIDPACLMGEIEPGALWYSDGRKCCVDCGAVFTGDCVLLDLDTWEEKVFHTEPYM